MTKMLKPASQDASDQVTAPTGILSVTQSSAGSSLQAFARAKPRHAHQSLQRLWQTGRFACMSLLMITASEAQKAPASGEMALEKAIAFYRADDYNQARTQLETLVKTEPTNATVCYYLQALAQRLNVSLSRVCFYCSQVTIHRSKMTWVELEL